MSALPTYVGWKKKVLVSKQSVHFRFHFLLLTTASHRAGYIEQVNYKKHFLNRYSLEVTAIIVFVHLPKFTNLTAVHNYIILTIWSWNSALDASRVVAMIYMLTSSHPLWFPKVTTLSFVFWLN